MQPQGGRSVSESVRGPESVQMQSAEQSRIGDASVSLRLREVGDIPVLVSRGQVQEAAGFVLQWLEYRWPGKEEGKREWKGRARAEEIWQKPTSKENASGRKENESGWKSKWRGRGKGWGKSGAGDGGRQNTGEKGEGGRQNTGGDEEERKKSTSGGNEQRRRSTSGGRVSGQESSDAEKAAQNHVARRRVKKNSGNAQGTGMWEWGPD